MGQKGPRLGNTRQSKRHRQPSKEDESYDVGKLLTEDKLLHNSHIRTGKKNSDSQTESGPLDVERIQSEWLKLRRQEKQVQRLRNLNQGFTQNCVQQHTVPDESRREKGPMKRHEQLKLLAEDVTDNRHSTRQYSEPPERDDHLNMVEDHSEYVGKQFV